MSEQQLSLVEHATLNPHSVEIGRGASGQVTIAVKVYAPTPGEAYALSKAIYLAAEADFPFVPKAGK